jgi:Lon protease-like protein
MDAAEGPAEDEIRPRRTHRLPLFPLATVLYPGLLLPLHIFEERYRRLVADLTEGRTGASTYGISDDSVPAFGVVAIREGREVRAPDVSGTPELFEFGCIAELRRVDTLPDGRFDIVTAGTDRFRLLGLDASGPYLVGEVEYLDEEPGEAAEVLAASVAWHFHSYRQALSAQGQDPRVRGDLPGEPLVLSYLVAAAMILDLRDKQRLLEAPDAAERLRAELALLRRERAILGKLPSLPGAELTRATISPN